MPTGVFPRSIEFRRKMAEMKKMKETTGHVEKMHDDEKPGGYGGGYFTKVWISDPSFNSLQLGKIEITQEEP